MGETPYIYGHSALETVCDAAFSSFAFNFNLRRYTMVMAPEPRPFNDIWRRWKRDVGYGPKDIRGECADEAAMTRQAGTSFSRAPDWSRGCFRGVQGVVTPEKWCKLTGIL